MPDSFLLSGGVLGESATVTAITGLLPSDKLLYSLTPVAGDLVQFTREFLEASDVMVGSCGRAAARDQRGHC